MWLGVFQFISECTYTSDCDLYFYILRTMKAYLGYLVTLKNTPQSSLSYQVPVQKNVEHIQRPRTSAYLEERQWSFFADVNPFRCHGNYKFTFQPSNNLYTAWGFCHILCFLGHWCNFNSFVGWNILNGKNNRDIQQEIKNLLTYLLYLREQVWV